MPLYLIKFQTPPSRDNLIEEYFHIEHEWKYQLSENVFLVYSKNSQTRMSAIFSSFEEKIRKEIFILPLSAYEGLPSNVYYIGTPNKDSEKLERLLGLHYQEIRDSLKESD